MGHNRFSVRQTCLFVLGWQETNQSLIWFSFTSQEAQQLKSLSGVRVNHQVINLCDRLQLSNHSILLSFLILQGKIRGGFTDGQSTGWQNSMRSVQPFAEQKKKKVLGILQLPQLRHIWKSSHLLLWNRSLTSCQRNLSMTSLSTTLKMITFFLYHWHCSHWPFRGLVPSVWFILHFAVLKVAVLCGFFQYIYILSIQYLKNGNVEEWCCALAHLIFQILPSKKCFFTTFPVVRRLLSPGAVGDCSLYVVQQRVNYTHSHTDAPADTHIL